MAVRRFLLVLLAAGAAAQERPIAGVGPTAKVVRLHTGFRFTEGPAADAHGSVFFTDIPNARIHKVDANGKLSVFAENSRRANGLMFTAQGVLVVCEGEGQVVAYAPDGKKRVVVAATFGDTRFNAPNDLVIDRRGGIYFTDPYFGPPKPLPQGTLGVYYVAPNGTVSRVLTNLPHPNGVILSPDEKTLYVVPSRSAEVRAYPVVAPGKLGKGRVFATLKQPEGRTGTGGDGLTVDTRGNLYITSRLGIQVYSSAGRLLGVLAFPEQPSNVTFGGKDFKTLYVTARTSLYCLRMEAQGHRFPAGRSR